jgi:hypothetical protein
MLALTLGLTATVAWAQDNTPTLGFGVTSRYAGMGEAGLALANDAGALDLNPAGLAAQSTPYLAPGACWNQAWGNDPAAAQHGMRGHMPGAPAPTGPGQLTLTDELSSNQHADGFDYAGSGPGSPWGWGAVYHHRSFDGETDSNWSVGGAYNLVAQRLALGLAYNHTDQDYPPYDYPFTGTGSYPPSSESHDLWNAGLIYLDPVSWTSVPARWGAVVDAGNGIEPIWNVGVAVPFDTRGGLCADWVDVFNAYDSHLNLGAEYWLGTHDDWGLRLGLADLGSSSHATENAGLEHSLAASTGSRWTAGASYRLRAWQFDLAWQQQRSPIDDSLKLSASWGW